MENNIVRMENLKKRVYDENLAREEYNIPIEQFNESMRGEIDMSDYVTKTEFDSTVKSLEKQIEHNQEMTNIKIDSVLAKIDSSNEILVEKINSIDKKIDIKFDHIEKDVSKLDSRVNWIIGLVVTSILIPIALKYFGI